MALSAGLISLIRDEIGDDLDFVDNEVDETASTIDSLESIYNDPERGQSNVLITALIVWRRRLANMQARGFDITKEGNWLARSQRVRFLLGRVSYYERLVMDKPSGRNALILSRAQQSSDTSINPDS